MVVKIKVREVREKERVELNRENQQHLSFLHQTTWFPRGAARSRSRLRIMERDKIIMTQGTTCSLVTHARAEQLARHEVETIAERIRYLFLLLGAPVSDCQAYLAERYLFRHDVLADEAEVKKNFRHLRPRPCLPCRTAGFFPS